MGDLVDRLRAIADAATECDDYAGPWSWVDRPADTPLGNELLVGSESEMGHIADVVPWAPELAEYVATFDPPTVRAILAVVEAARTVSAELPTVDGADELVDALAGLEAAVDEHE